MTKREALERIEEIDVLLDKKNVDAGDFFIGAYVADGHAHHEIDFISHEVELRDMLLRWRADYVTYLARRVT